MHIQRVIEKLGYKQSEAKVYLAALQLGACTVTDLAFKTGLPRTTVQEIVATLEKSNLINPFSKNSHKHLIAENPNKLLTVLKEQQAALEAIMPELHALKSDNDIRPVIRIYTGSDEIVRIYDDILETRHHIYAIVMWDDWTNLLGKELVSDFIQSRCEHFLQIKLLTPKTPSSEQLREKDGKELRTTRFIPKKMLIKNSNFIYGDKVAIVSLNKKLPVGIVMQDADVAHTMLALFNVLWENAEVE